MMIIISFPFVADGVSVNAGAKSITEIKSITHKKKKRNITSQSTHTNIKTFSLCIFKSYVNFYSAPVVGSSNWPYNYQ